MTQTQIPSDIQIFNKEQTKDATVDILNHITEVLFYFFEEQEENLEDDGILSDFVSNMWDIAVVSMAACGMRVLGKSPDGSYFVSFRPEKSVKEFLINEDYAEDGQVFFEEFVDEAPGETYIGRHEKRLIGE
jgi:hypothetical protein